MATFYGICAIVLWGGLALLSSITVDIPAFQQLFLCFSISSALLFAKRLIQGQALLTKPALTVTQWFVGVGGLFGFHFCYFMALKMAPVIEVSLISYLWPMLLALFISTAKNFISALTGSLMGFVGVGFVVVAGGELSFNQQHITGYLLAICCAFTWSLYSRFQAKTTQNVEDIGWLSLVVALLALAAHLQLETTYLHLNANQWFGILLLGIGPIGGAFYLWDIGLKNGNTKLLASLSYCAPLISAISLSVVGLSTWSINLVLSLFFILIGVLISQQKLHIINIFNKKNSDY